MNLEQLLPEKLQLTDPQVALFFSHVQIMYRGKSKI